LPAGYCNFAFVHTRILSIVSHTFNCVPLAHWIFWASPASNLLQWYCCTCCDRDVVYTVFSYIQMSHKFIVVTVHMLVWWCGSSHSAHGCLVVWISLTSRLLQSSLCTCTFSYTHNRQSSSVHALRESVYIHVFRESLCVHAFRESVYVHVAYIYCVKGE